jgi:hypothetical protein
MSQLQIVIIIIIDHKDFTVYRPIYSKKVGSWFLLKLSVYSEMCFCVVREMGTNVFEEHTTSIFNVQKIEKAVASSSYLPKPASHIALSLPENL